MCAPILGSRGFTTKTSSSRCVGRTGLVLFRVLCRDTKEEKAEERRKNPLRSQAYADSGSSPNRREQSCNLCELATIWRQSSFAGAGNSLRSPELRNRRML